MEGVSPLVDHSIGTDNGLTEDVDHVSQRSQKTTGELDAIMSW